MTDPSVTELLFAVSAVALTLGIPSVAVVAGGAIVGLGQQPPASVLNRALTHR